MSTDLEEERMRLISDSSTDDALGAMDPFEIDDIKLYLNLSTRYKNRFFFKSEGCTYLLYILCYGRSLDGWDSYVTNYIMNFAK